MGPNTAQRIEAISKWRPPAGVTWTIQYQSQTGTIVLAMRSGDFADVHFVLGDGESERLLAIKAAEALRDRWLAELESPGPQWLAEAKSALHYLSTTQKVSGVVLDRAALILGAIEAEDIDGPAVLTATVSGCVRLGWRRGSRCISIEIQAGLSIEITEWTTEYLVSRETHRSGLLDAARTAIASLYPEANSGSYQEML